MVKNGFKNKIKKKWSKTVEKKVKNGQYGQKRSKMVNNGQKQSNMVKSSEQQPKIVKKKEKKNVKNCQK